VAKHFDSSPLVNCINERAFDCFGIAISMPIVATKDDVTIAG